MKHRAGLSTAIAPDTIVTRMYSGKYAALGFTPQKSEKIEGIGYRVVAPGIQFPFKEVEIKDKTDARVLTSLDHHDIRWWMSRLLFQEESELSSKRWASAPRRPDSPCVLGAPTSRESSENSEIQKFRKIREKYFTRDLKCNTKLLKYLGSLSNFKNMMFMATRHGVYHSVTLALFLSNTLPEEKIPRPVKRA
ncbi:hypothetical protein G5I_09431 [Acromyrmex echinatior]|uniref:Uncharacterized protein n=1 Tax=Acromyrmex echinatior TaxID=103372 RepID=F4WU74_ACREC|nr:hypothetical protein G5I_09431 [Acromyrmex echinatior]